MTELTEDQFYAIDFIQNHLDDNASWDGTMFETYGAEVEFIKSQEPNKIWTLIDVDYGMSVVAGWHFVNRIGYFISDKPWTDENTYFYMPNEFECIKCNIEMVEEDNRCIDCDDEVCYDCCTEKEHQDERSL